ncbi:MAG: hypothetical protein R3266_09855, partial [Gemmatimonadota bacterium]|nr:hypothetical protein [Gemmatimonadota bacterium]
MTDTRERGDHSRATAARRAVIAGRALADPPRARRLRHGRLLVGRDRRTVGPPARRLREGRP